MVGLGLRYSRRDWIKSTFNILVGLAVGVVVVIVTNLRLVSLGRRCVTFVKKEAISNMHVSMEEIVVRLA